MALLRCVNVRKLFPGGLLQRSHTNPWVLSAPGSAASPPLLRFSKLHGIASLASPPPQLPSPNSPPPQQEAAGGAASCPNSRRPRKTKAASSSIVSDGGAAAASISPLPPSPFQTQGKAAGGAASSPRSRKPRNAKADGGAAAASSTSPPRQVPSPSPSPASSPKSPRPRKVKASSTVSSPPDGSTVSSAPPPAQHPPSSGSISSTPSQGPAIPPHKPRTPRQMELAKERMQKRRLKMRQCPRSHARLPKGKGQYLYTPGGDFCGYIPTPDEVFPSVLNPELREDEAKYVRERFTKDPDSIAKPGKRFAMSPVQCEHNVVETVHERVVMYALRQYYFGDGKGGRRGKMPCSDYAEMLISE